MPSLKRRVELVALAALRACGAFHVARRLTGRGLRILCYHGFSVADEHRFRPGMWIRGDSFARRLAYLRRAGHPVLPLDEALERLAHGTLPPAAVAITIDDGFAGTHSVAVPVLHAYHAPSTLYLTTYYVVQQDPVFDLAVGYLLFRTAVDTLDPRPLGVPELATPLAWKRLSAAAREATVAAIVRHGHEQLGREARARLLERLAELTAVPLAPVLESRMFHLLNEDEVRAVHAAGVAIELHTHRHATPVTAACASAELAENRRHIVRLTGREPRHFCYPSGRYGEWDPDWLSAADVRSATTTVPGFDYATTPWWQLSRFNDGESVPQLMFEAEMSGMLELIRRLRARLRGERRARDIVAPSPTRVPVATPARPRVEDRPVRIPNYAAADAVPGAAHGQPSKSDRRPVA